MDKGHQRLYAFETDDSGILTVLDDSVTYATIPRHATTGVPNDVALVVDQWDQRVHYPRTGTRDTLRMLDVSECDDLLFGRYLLVASTLDGRSIVGISQEDELLFVVHPTWREGVGSRAFFAAYRAGGCPRAVLRMPFPPPPPPPLSE